MQIRMQLQTSSRILDLYMEDPVKFIRLYVTMGETCAHHFDPEMKRQSMQWTHPTSPPLVKFRPQGYDVWISGWRSSDNWLLVAR